MSDISNPKVSGNLSIIRRDWLFFLVWSLLSFRLFSCIADYYFDSDIYHMLAAGKAISNFGIIREDIFFVDSGHSIVIQQLFYDLFVYKIYSVFGNIGILVTCFVFALLFIILAVRLLMYFNIDRRLAITITLAVCLYAKGIFTIRPGIFSIVLLLIGLCLCERHLKTGKSIYLYLLPVLTLIEINFHSTFWIAHFIFLLPYIVPIPSRIRKHVLLDDHHIDLKKLVFPVILMTISLFINPYGFDGIMVLFRQKEISRLGIAELESPHLSSKFAIIFILILIITVFAYGKTRIRSSNAFLFAGTSLMLIMNVRNIQMFAIGIIPIIGDLISCLTGEKIDNILGKIKSAYKIILSILVLLLIGLLAFGTDHSGWFRKTPSDSVRTPVLAVEYLNEQADKDDRIYTDFNSGGYISWYDYKIYFCSRTEEYCKDLNDGYDLISEYISIFKNTGTDCKETFDAFLIKYDFDYLVVESKNRMYPYLIENDSYEIVVTGNGYAVFKPV